MAPTILSCQVTDLSSHLLVLYVAAGGGAAPGRADQHSPPAPAQGRGGAQPATARLLQVSEFAGLCHRVRHGECCGVGACRATDTECREEVFGLLMEVFDRCVHDSVKLGWGLIEEVGLDMSVMIIMPQGGARRGLRGPGRRREGTSQTVTVPSYRPLGYRLGT